jgi:DNA-binding GntR family transcriptional regulator
LARLAVVHPLDGLTTVERVCEDIRAAIHAGHLLPGQEVILRDIAEHRRVRYGSLVTLLGGLERDGLLVRRGGVAIVAALDSDELTSMFALRRSVESHLVARACARISDAELDRLDALVPTGVARNPDATFGHAMREFNLGLFRPAASTVEVRVIQNIHEATRRYHSLGIRVLRAADGDGLGGLSPSGLLAHLDRCHELIERFRARNAMAVRETVLSIIGKSEVLARQSFSADFEIDREVTARVVASADIGA